MVASCYIVLRRYFRFLEGVSLLYRVVSNHLFKSGTFQGPANTLGTSGEYRTYKQVYLRSRASLDCAYNYLPTYILALKLLLRRKVLLIVG
jgi:hypothetical protein